jgi:hypothetical protein
MRSDVCASPCSRISLVLGPEEGMGPDRPIRRDDFGGCSNGDGDGRLQGESPELGLAEGTLRGHAAPTGRTVGDRQKVVVSARRTCITITKHTYLECYLQS